MSEPVDPVAKEMQAALDVRRRALAASERAAQERQREVLAAEVERRADVCDAEDAIKSFVGAMGRLGWPYGEDFWGFPKGLFQRRKYLGVFWLVGIGTQSRGPESPSTNWCIYVDREGGLHAGIEGSSMSRPEPFSFDAWRAAVESPNSSACLLAWPAAKSVRRVLIEFMLHNNLSWIEEP